ncbi:S8 family serine peptidase [Nocardioides sp. SR21]|uniref:S8 family serine peptidase n=1 Tax=Nocardioides sp. SR21 TaxID=2919501 RepID=UPI001FAA600D|nr:S8 family serine peptidase [Nocardioides sp. SR21]
MLAGALLPLALVSPASAETTGSPCTGVSPGQTVVPVDGPSEPLVTLGIADLQDRVPALGAGRNVAVVDSGVYDGARLDVLASESFTGSRELLDGHGTAVAGVIAGQPREEGQAVGIAPRARIIDVRVYDEAGDGLDPDRVAAGLNWVADNAKRYDIAVANVSLAFDRDVPAIERAVRRLWNRDVVVVASSGNRPTEEGEPGLPELAAPMKPGEDAEGLFRPAAYPHVLAVNASGRPGEDVTQFVVQNSDTDLAAPTFGLVSLAVTGDYCVIDEIATSWSAAVVSGVVSLLRSAYPKDTAAQTVARLLETANGTAGTRTRLTGHGVIQPLEALTRPLAPASDGTLAYAAADTDQPRATAPEPADDLLASTRDDAVWWGLIGGGVLVVALLLRPVLSRRR